MTEPADFRSDTLTRPSPEMRAAMASAEVGDDVFGEDPTVNILEKEAARFLGTEASLFVPSGSMANQIAVRVHCRSGDELICEERCHVFQFEGGSPAGLSGVQVRPLRAESGFPRPGDVLEALRADDPHFPRSRLLVIENTHNMAGGRVLGRQAMNELVAVARRAELRVHVDGARLVNAATAANCTVAELAAGADSVSLCFSKGLGAPVGSVIGGSAGFVAHARRARKAFGGGMRQVGILAAAAKLALDSGPDRVVEDHRRARALGDAFAGLSVIKVRPVESNIVMVDVGGGVAQELVSVLAADGVLALPVGSGCVRFVTHCDVDDGHVDRCIETMTHWASN
ncbi:MAG: low specificity L-threonine aldolase [Planctomycetaceae bacterium]|nr:low specificity L-threonine aldolase [Planctomycetaceae bacterium]